MHVYLPEKYRSPFLHGVFLFLKVGVLTVNFNGFFALAYSSHILWSWLLGRTWCHHTSLSFALYLKDCQFCLTFFLRKGIMEPTLPRVFDCPPAWSCPQVFNSGLGMRLYEGRFGFWQGVTEFLEFQSYSRHKNHFDIDSKQTYSEEIQVIPMEGFSEVMKNFCFDFGEKYEVTSSWSKRFQI